MKNVTADLKDTSLLLKKIAVDIANKNKSILEKRASDSKNRIKLDSHQVLNFLKFYL